MPFRIIDNKKIEVTDAEFNHYEQICKSFTKDNFDGKHLFKNLFETDGDGIIIFLRAPSHTFSMEAVVFLQNLMVHQHLRKIYKEHDEEMAELKKLKKQVKEMLDKMIE